MAERKNLTISEVKSVEKVGKNQTPKLSFKAKDGDKELWYFSFRTSLFEAIKEGQAINADIETSSREYDGNTYIDRKVVQVYVDGQPLGGQKSQYRGKSPEELELSARAYALSYAKDLAVAQVIKTSEITKQADDFYNWLKKNGAKAEPKEKPAEEQKQVSEETGEIIESEDLAALILRNPGEFYTACLDHFKLSKSKVDTEIAEYDITKVDQRKRAWETIITIYGHRISSES